MNMKIDNSKQKGSITVFLSIILFTIVSFIFLLIDVTRIYGAQNQFSIASNNAAKSAMANYNAELFNEYGLFAYNSSDAVGIAEEVFNKNIDPAYGGGEVRGGSKILKLQGDVSVTETEPLFAGTDTFKKQMIYAMKYQGTENLAINVFERLVGLIEAAKQASITEDMAEIDEALDGISKKLGKVEQAKINAQRAIIALVLANNIPKFKYISEYTKTNDFDPQIGSNELLKMINESIGEVFFTGDLSQKDEVFIKGPIQNIYLYYYAIQVVNSYRRSYVEEYEKAKVEYEAALEKYEIDMEKYEADKEKYDKEMEEYEEALEDYKEKMEEYKENGSTGSKPSKPEKPTTKEPKEPEPPKKPKILEDDIEEFKRSMNSFTYNLQEYINNFYYDYFDKSKKYIGYYMKLLDEGKEDIESLINDESKRNEILAMADNLETKINEVSMSDKVKEEVKEYIANVRKVLNQDTLESVEKDIVAINSILKNYKKEFVEDADSVKKNIESLMNSSTDKIPIGNKVVSDFVNKIKENYKSTLFNESAVSIVNSTFVDDSLINSCSELSYFTETLISYHKSMKITENLNGDSIIVDNLDVGKRNEEDKNAEDVGDALNDAKEDEKESKSLKRVLEALDSKESISDLSFGTSGNSDNKSASEITELQEYSGAFESESYDASLLDRIYITEYIMTNFKDLVDYEKYTTADNRTPKETDHDSVLNYEVEAIVNGKFGDEANVNSMTTWVKNFRIACNTLTIYDTKKMRTFTEKAAERICEVLAAGFSLFPATKAVAAAIRSKPFKKITQAGLILGWANMEANLDTSDIFRGYYVPLIKEPEEWIMDLGLKLENGAGGDGADRDTVDKALDNLDEPEKGENEAYNTQPENNEGIGTKVCYSDILRARLLIKMIRNEESVINGTKELVNANMKKVSEGFDYSSYYSGMEISVNSSVNTWFNSSSFTSGGRVSFKQFKYVKRYN